MATNEDEVSKGQRNTRRSDAETKDDTVDHSKDDQRVQVDLQNRTKTNSRLQPVFEVFQGETLAGLSYDTVQKWVSYISYAYDMAKDELIETGCRLIEAEQTLKNETLSEVYTQLGFSARRAQQLKDLYRHFGHLDASKLPNTDRALNELKKLDHGQLEQAIQQGEIHRGIKSEDAQAVVQRYRGETTQAATSSQTTNYKLGHLRRLITTFENVTDEEIEGIVERLRDDERKKLKCTLEALEQYLQAGEGGHEK